MVGDVLGAHVGKVWQATIANPSGRLSITLGACGLQGSRAELGSCGAAGGAAGLLGGRRGGGSRGGSRCALWQRRRQA